jgi:outer membrane protein assembly factor BamD (BamD/ComL family)
MRVLLFGTVAAAALLAAPPVSPRAVAQDDSPEALFQTGMSRFTAGDYETSVTMLTELVKVFGREPELRSRIDLAMYAKACALYNLERRDECVKAFREYVAQFPESKFVDEALFRIGVCLQQDGDHQEAVAAYRQLRSSHPGSAYAEDAAFQIGLCHLLDEANADAAAAFKDFIALYPRSRLAAQAGAYAARALFDDDKPLEAIEMLQETEKLHRPWSVVTYCNFLAFEIGDSLFDDGEFASALTAYRRVKPRRAILQHLKHDLARLEAEQAAFERRPVSAQNLSTHYRAARQLARDVEQNREMLQKLETMPDYDANLFHRIGRCFFNTDRHWEARVAFKRVVDTADDDEIREAAHFDLILAISRLRRFDDLLVESDSYLSTYDPEGHWQ